MLSPFEGDCYSSYRTNLLKMGCPGRQLPSVTAKGRMPRTAYANRPPRPAKRLRATGAPKTRWMKSVLRRLRWARRSSPPKRLCSEPEHDAQRARHGVHVGIFEDTDALSQHVAIYGTGFACIEVVLHRPNLTAHLASSSTQADSKTIPPAARWQKAPPRAPLGEPQRESPDVH